MTQEEKQLLLIDLLSRLPYWVRCQFIWTYSNETTGGEDVIAKEDDNIRCIDIHTKDIQAYYYGEWVDLEHCKPYLRPMSSMTQDEIDEYFLELNKDEELLLQAACDNNPKHRIVGSDRTSTTNKFVTHFGNDWLNAHHFDYRGLIEKGLALEAPKNMYKLNNK